MAPTPIAGAAAARLPSTWKAPRSPSTVFVSLCPTAPRCAWATSRCTARSSCPGMANKHLLPPPWQDYTCSYIVPAVAPTNRDKPLEWVGSSYKDLMSLPAAVRRFFGYALSLAQRGDQHDAAKALKGFSGAGVVEVVEDDVGGTYRAVYTVKFEEAVFVLHCFQKKSKRGIATPKADVDLVRARLKVAEARAKEIRDGKADR
jgi:phage-related protein